MDEVVSPATGRSIIGVTPKGRLALLSHLGISQPYSKLSTPLQSALMRTISHHIKSVARKEKKEPKIVLQEEIAKVILDMEQIGIKLGKKRTDPQTIATFLVLRQRLRWYYNILYIMREFKQV
ncbi:MAG: hypothetical protein V1776_04530 [Candidatus Diapherotrites archaeon]